MNDEDQEENILRTKCALINVINIYITDFDKSNNSLIIKIILKFKIFFKNMIQS